MLSRVIDIVDYPSRHRNGIFILLYIFMAPAAITTGVNYTGCRFLAAPLFSLLVFRRVQSGSLRDQIKGSLQAVLFTFLLLVISPEAGVAFCLGVSTFFFFFYRLWTNRARIPPYLAMLLALTLLMVVADRLDVFLTLKSVANGGYNFPIVPAAHILILFYTVFVCACYVAKALSRLEFGSNSLLLTFVSLPLVSACLGRCDPGHVVFNGMGLFILCMLLISNHALVWKWYSFLFAITFIVLGVASTLLFDAASIPDAFASRLKGSFAPDATMDAVALPPYLKGIAEVPFGYMASHNPTSLEGGYYFGLENALDSNAVKSKISELEQNPSRELLIPKGGENNCQGDVDTSRLIISLLFIYPFNEKVIHPESIYTPLCNYITRNYYLKISPRQESYDYGIWARK